MKKTGYVLVEAKDIQKDEMKFKERVEWRG